ncbi:MAG TPA: response regulator [Kofleriaceae bacterium]|nr:response regulator [Kofleriaceae bacterium]
MSRESSEKILLIDDSELSLEICAEMLEGAGFDVRTSATVDNFDEVLEGWRPDVILTDVNMPGISGVDLCRKLKSRYDTAHVPVVLLSALDAKKLEVLARECEADGFLSKADGLDKLPDELSALIDSTLF